MPTVNQSASETYDLVEVTNSNPNSTFRPTDRFVFSEKAVRSGQGNTIPNPFEAVIDVVAYDAIIGVGSVHG